MSEAVRREGLDRAVQEVLPSMSPARFVRNSTGGFVPSKRSATPTAASPRLNVSVAMSSTEIVL